MAVVRKPQSIGEGPAEVNPGIGRLPLIGAVAVVMVGLAACVGHGPPVAVCARTASPRPSESTRVVPNHSVVAVMTARDGSGSVLARRDPLSLQLVSAQVQIAEYHDAWSLSPDGSQIALAISAQASEFGGREGRVGVLLVDLDTMRVVRGIETGIAAEALAWLAPHVLVAALQRGGIVLIDPATGRITQRWPDFSSPDTSARTKDSLVMLAGPAYDTSERTAAARLAVVDARAGLRSVTLERIRLRLRVATGTEYTQAKDRAGLALDPERERAYVVAAGAPVAEVDLPTMRVTYHLEPWGAQPHGDVLAHERDALWVGDQHMVVFGRDLLQSGDAAAGANLIDTAAWRSCIIDAKADGAATTSGTLLVYAARARPGVGLRAYTSAGQPIFHLFDEEQVSRVSVADGLAYVQTASAIRVVDAQTGEALSTIASSSQIVDVIAVPS